MLGPLKQDFSAADPQNNASWKIIPASFEKESWGEEVIVFDAHVNEGVVEKAMGDKKILNSILYYILQKF